MRLLSARIFFVVGFLAMPLAGAETNPSMGFPIQVAVCSGSLFVSAMCLFLSAQLSIKK